MTDRIMSAPADHAQALGPLWPLAEHRQFIVSKIVPLADGKTDKLPIDYRTGNVCSAHDPAVWTDYATAAALAARWGDPYRVGFVLTAADPFFCIDLDSVLLPTNEWAPDALHLLAALPGTVVEISQSGRGLHVWGQGPVPPHGCKRMVGSIKAELYTERRFVLLGTGAKGDMTQRCPTIAGIAAAYFPPDAASAASVPESGPCPEWRGPTDDAELIRRALQSRSAANTFGTRASFADLWTANADALARAYPAQSSTSATPYDASSADAALAAHLAWWTGRDVARIERLMRQSALARPKWDNRDDYLVDRTIRGACARQIEVLQDKLPERVDPPAGTHTAESIAAPTMRTVEGSTFVSIDLQARVFAGCVYIIEQHRVLCPGGMLLKPEQFKARYGGFTFAMDNRNERTTRNAFEAFTESQVLRAPQANGTCFRPDLEPAALVTDAGRVRANTWWPIETPRRQGDPAPFLQHLAKLVPDERDRQILLSWMACAVQFPGRKFQCAPFLQGVEGNGKTFFSRCLSEILGKRYTHWPDASKLGEKFNGWLYGRLLICVEDIHAGHRDDVLERLKPWITGTDGVEIEGKGIDQITAEIVANFIFNSNHKAGIRKTRNDRRYITFICPQQHEPDLGRDGLTPDYFKALYEWAKGGGYAVVHDYLATYPVPDELRFDRGIRAPATSTTEAAIEAGRSRAEREILDAIEQGQTGFRGGFVSSTFLQSLLATLPRHEQPTASLKDMMRALGYLPHPALPPKGQTDNPVMPDGRKAVLYVAVDSEAASIGRRASVAAAYSVAQGMGVLPPPSPQSPTSGR